jgi:Phosphotransferase enzyme family
MVRSGGEADEVAAWLGAHGVEPTAALDVVHVRPWSTVTRVATAGGVLYLKQCAPVQAFEPPLTLALAERWPDRVPQVVAADVERAWLLLRDGGLSLRVAGTLEPFGVALERYGELQVAEAARADELLAMGVPDVRLPVLAAAYAPFVERDHGLEPHEAARLRALAPRFGALCDALAAFGLPASIQHDDLHDANIFVRDGAVAIYDWGDSSVAHPLFSWLKPLRLATERRLDLDALRTAYLGSFRALLDERRLRAALALAVPVGSCAYALQYQRQLDAMPADVRPPYTPYMREQLRVLLGRLETT